MTKLVSEESVVNPILVASQMSNILISIPARMIAYDPSILMKYPKENVAV